MRRGGRKGKRLIETGRNENAASEGWRTKREIKGAGNPVGRERANHTELGKEQKSSGYIGAPVRREGPPYREVFGLGSAKGLRKKMDDRADDEIPTGS